MVWCKFKWKCILFTFIILFNDLSKSLPAIKSSSLLKSDTELDNYKSSVAPIAFEKLFNNYSDILDENKNVSGGDVTVNATRSAVFRNIRPGQIVRSYVVEITVNGNSFNGRAVLDVLLTADTREDSIILHAEGLSVNSVKAAILGGSNFQDVDFYVDDGELEISPESVASMYSIIIEYSGQLSKTGRGLYLGGSDQNTYLAMNLHPTYARRVFPCMDEPTEAPMISFSFEGLHYTHVTSNSILSENSQTQFLPLVGPPHLWGMIAHNFITVNIPTANVMLFSRPGVSNQDSQASVAINFFFHDLNEWTQKPYFEVIQNQDGRMNIMVLPDVSTDWNSLSTVGIWWVFEFLNLLLYRFKESLFSIITYMPLT